MSKTFRTKNRPSSIDHDEYIRLLPASYIWYFRCISCLRKVFSYSFVCYFSKLKGNFPEYPETFPDCPETFKSVWKLFQIVQNFSIVPKSFPEFPKTFQSDRKLSKIYEKNSEYPEFFQSVWQFSRLPRNLPGCPKSLLSAQKLLVPFFIFHRQKLSGLQNISLKQCLSASDVFLTQRQFYWFCCHPKVWTHKYSYILKCHSALSNYFQIFV